MKTLCCSSDGDVNSRPLCKDYHPQWQLKNPVIIKNGNLKTDILQPRVYKINILLPRMFERAYADGMAVGW